MILTYLSSSCNHYNQGEVTYLLHFFLLLFQFFRLSHADYSSKGVRMNTHSLENISNGARVAVSVSGGLDSVTLLHYVAKHVSPANTFAISFDYNQRHDLELSRAREQAQAAGLPAENYKVVDVRFLGDIAANVSAMVKSDLEIPNVEDTLGDPQPVSYMPMRNLIFSSLVAAFAESNNCEYVALGIQETDQHGYWDTTPAFVEALQGVLDLNRKTTIQLLTPFVRMSKAEELRIGAELGIDYSKTWTCYNPLWLDKQTPVACGKCSSCADRRNAFRSIGLEDPLQYA